MLTHTRTKPVEQPEAVGVVDDDARVARRLRDDVVESSGVIVPVEACHPYTVAIDAYSDKTALRDSVRGVPGFSRAPGLQALWCLGPARVD